MDVAGGAAGFVNIAHTERFAACSGRERVQLPYRCCARGVVGAARFNAVGSVEVDEEAGDVADEEVGGVEAVALGDQLRKAYVGYDVVAVGGDELFVYALEVEHVEYVGGGVADVDAECDVGGVGREWQEVGLFVCVFIVMVKGGDVAED